MPAAKRRAGTTSAWRSASLRRKARRLPSCWSPVFSPGASSASCAMGGNFEGAVFAIIAAGIFDGLDGRMARLLKATSSFGAELDSLSDFVSFGVAPAAVLYLWTMSELHVLGWVIVLFFAVCCALRLARFNTEATAGVPAYAAPFFSGAPAPAGAGLVMIPMFLSFEWGDGLFRSPY